MDVTRQGKGWGSAGYCGWWPRMQQTLHLTTHGPTLNNKLLPSPKHQEIDSDSENPGLNKSLTLKAAQMWSQGWRDCSEREHWETLIAGPWMNMASLTPKIKGQMMAMIITGERNQGHRNSMLLWMERQWKNSLFQQHLSHVLRISLPFFPHSFTLQGSQLGSV